MFFLKGLPTRRMMDAYTSRYNGVETDTVAEALHMMRRASLLIRGLEAYFAEHGLSQLRFLILIVIDREEGCESLPPHAIAERLDVSRPVTTRTLKTLIDDGLVKLRANEDDGRAKEAFLTKAGKDRLAQVLPGYFGVIMQFMAESEAS